MSLRRQAPNIFRFLIALLVLAYAPEGHADVPRFPRNTPKPDHQYFAITGKQGFTLSLEGGAKKRCFIRPHSDFDEAACVGIDAASAEQLALEMPDQTLLMVVYLRFEGYDMPTTILALDDVGELQREQMKEVLHDLLDGARQGAQLAERGAQVSDELNPQTELSRINGIPVMRLRAPMSVTGKSQQAASLTLESHIVFVEGRTFILRFYEPAAHLAACEKAVREILSTITGNPTSKKYDHADQLHKRFTHRIGYHAGALLVLLIIVAVAVRMSRRTTSRK